MRNRTAAALFAMIAATFAATYAFAQQPRASGRMYKCVDVKGKVYYTQVPPKECLGKETQELSGQGQVVRRIEAPPTPEQQAAREAERKKLQQQEIAAREDRRRTQALLNTYSSERDIEEARARALKDNEAGILDIEKRIAAAEKRGKRLESEKEFYAKKTLPPKLQDDIKANEVETKTQRGLLDAKKKQVNEINAKYDEDKKRYVELTKGKPASSAPTAAKK